MSNRKQSNEPSPHLRRKALEADLQAFLEAGKSIEQVPTGVSGQDQQGRSKKQIVLGYPGKTNR